MTVAAHIPTPEEKKKFAQSQLQFLKDRGLNDAMRLSRIFKAAGPGQVQESWRLVDQAKDAVRRDLLDCLLTGAGGSQDFGKERMEDVLKTCGFDPPKVHSSTAFFRVLDGAMELLVPGSFEFSPEELKDIEQGLAKERAKKATIPQ